MLILGRKAGQAVQVKLSDLTDPNTPIGEIFPEGVGITVTVCRLKRGSVKIGIKAPESLSVVRDELAEK